MQPDAEMRLVADAPAMASTTWTGLRLPRPPQLGLTPVSVEHASVTREAVTKVLKQLDGLVESDRLDPTHHKMQKIASESLFLFICRL